MNILYIHTHDSGRVLSPYGYDVPTPSLKKFAKDAVLFQQAYCVSPTCSPSRAALLTGTYPHQNGMLGLAQRGFQLDVSKHLVQYLNNHNYHTLLCGIQHEAGWYLDHEKGAEMIGYQEDITCDNQDYRQEDLPKWDQNNAKTLANWIQKYNSKKPFFISYGMYATHRRYPDTIADNIDENEVLPPYPIPNTKDTRQDHARYMTSAQVADDCIETVLNAIKKQNLYEDTIIIFTTDHGLANPFSKCTLFDSGIGVSLIMRVPGSKTNGKVIDEMVSHIDVFPTLCDLLNLEKPTYLEGQSFANIFQNEHESLRKEIYGEVNFHTSYEPIRCVRNKRYKYIRYYDGEYLKMNLSNIDESQTKDFFMNHNLQDKIKYKEALYDTYYDLGERNNVIEQVEYKNIIDELRNSLDLHMKKTNDPLLNGIIEIQNGWKVNKKECHQASSKNPDDYVVIQEKGA